MTPLITPLAEIHFNPPVKWKIDNPIDKNYLYELIINDGFILIIVLTNFINLTTAQSSKRQKEIGLRIIEESINYSFENTNATVFGVVKDFAYKSVKEKI
jgi:hypothetical protein